MEKLIVFFVILLTFSSCCCFTPADESFCKKRLTITDSDYSAIAFKDCDHFNFNIIYSRVADDGAGRMIVPLFVKVTQSGSAELLFDQPDFIFEVLRKIEVEKNVKIINFEFLNPEDHPGNGIKIIYEKKEITNPITTINNRTTDTLQLSNSKKELSWLVKVKKGMTLNGMGMRNDVAEDFARENQLKYWWKDEQLYVDLPEGLGIVWRTIK